MAEGDLVFLDIETTGLDPEIHEIIEVAWAVKDEEILLHYPKHTLKNANVDSLAINKYWERGFSTDGMYGPSDSSLRRYGIWKLNYDLAGSTVVCMNPWFDTAFLRKYLGYRAWHHRLFDMGSYAAGVLGFPRPMSSKDIRTFVNGHGYKTPEADHTAAGDVENMRQLHKALGQIRAKRFYINSEASQGDQ